MVRFVASDLNDEFSAALTAIQRSAKGWPNYLLGVIEEYRVLGHAFPGCDVVFGGDIPIGAGMSSSAAVECGFAFALNQLFGFGISKMDLVKLGQRSENNFVGMNCGIMDESSMFLAKTGRCQHPLPLFCVRTLSVRTHRSRHRVV